MFSWEQSEWRFHYILFIFPSLNPKFLLPDFATFFHYGGNDFKRFTLLLLTLHKTVIRFNSKISLSDWVYPSYVKKGHLKTVFVLQG